MSEIKTIIELRDRLIKDGIKSVREHEKRPERIRGGVAGFELCRTLATTEDFTKTLDERRRKEHQMYRDRIDAETYWEYRYATIQIEFVFERLKVGWGMTPLSARAVMHYAKLVGLKGEIQNP